MIKELIDTTGPEATVSRDTYALLGSKNYETVVIREGKVAIDAEVNEAQDLILNERVELTRDLVTEGCLIGDVFGDNILRDSFVVSWDGVNVKVAPGRARWAQRRCDLLFELSSGVAGNALSGFVVPAVNGDFKFIYSDVYRREFFGDTGNPPANATPSVPGNDPVLSDPVVTGEQARRIQWFNKDTDIIATALNTAIPIAATGHKIFPLAKIERVTGNVVVTDLRDFGGPKGSTKLYDFVVRQGGIIGINCTHTDLTEALADADALGLATGNSVSVFIASGTYQIDALITITKSIKLVGHTQAKDVASLPVVIEPSGAFVGTNLIVVDSGAVVEMNDLFISKSTGSAVHVLNGKLLVSDCSIERITSSNVTNLTGSIFSNSTFLRGVALGLAESNIFNGCTFVNGQLFVLVTSNLTNHAVNCVFGVAAPSFTVLGNNLIISDSFFESVGVINVLCEVNNSKFDASSINIQPSTTNAARFDGNMFQGDVFIQNSGTTIEMDGCDIVGDLNFVDGIDTVRLSNIRVFGAVATTTPASGGFGGKIEIDGMRVDGDFDMTAFPQLVFYNIRNLDVRGGDINIPALGGSSWFANVRATGTITTVALGNVCRMSRIQADVDFVVSNGTFYIDDAAVGGTFQNDSPATNTTTNVFVNGLLCGNINFGHIGSLVTNTWDFSNVRVSALASFSTSGSKNLVLKIRGLYCDNFSVSNTSGGAGTFIVHEISDVVINSQFVITEIDAVTAKLVNIKASNFVLAPTNGAFIYANGLIGVNSVALPTLSISGSPLPYTVVIDNSSFINTLAGNADAGVVEIAAGVGVTSVRTSNTRIEGVGRRAVKNFTSAVGSVLELYSCRIKTGNTVSPAISTPVLIDVSHCFFTAPFGILDGGGGIIARTAVGPAANENNQ